MSKIKEVTLGSKVKDKITGLTGTAIGRTVWLTGCARIIVQPKPKEGEVEVPKTFVVDEPLVITLEPDGEPSDIEESEVDRSIGGFDIAPEKY